MGVKGITGDMNAVKTGDKGREMEMMEGSRRLCRKQWSLLVFMKLVEKLQYLLYCQYLGFGLWGSRNIVS